SLQFETATAPFTRFAGAASIHSLHARLNLFPQTAKGVAVRTAAARQVRHQRVEIVQALGAAEIGLLCFGPSSEQLGDRDGGVPAACGSAQGLDRDTIRFRLL